MANKQQQPQPQDPPQVMEQMLAKRLRDTEFPLEDSERELLAQLLRPERIGTLSIAQLVGDARCYLEVRNVDPTAPVNMFAVSFLLNMPEKLSPHAAGIALNDPEAYVRWLKQYEPMIERWNKMAVSLRTAAMREAQAVIEKQIIIPKAGLHLAKGGRA